MRLKGQKKKRKKLQQQAKLLKKVKLIGTQRKEKSPKRQLQTGLQTQLNEINQKIIAKDGRFKRYLTQLAELWNTLTAFVLRDKNLHQDKYPGYDTKLHRMVRLQFKSFGEYGVLLHCHYS